MNPRLADPGGAVKNERDPQGGEAQFELGLNAGAGWDAPRLRASASRMTFLSKVNPTTKIPFINITQK
jgi:hypothetical protein